MPRYPGKKQTLTSPANTEHRCQIKHCYCKDGQPIEDVTQPPVRRKPPFSQTHPEIAKFWDYKKNCGWEPSDFGSGSHVVAWWSCPAAADHKWTQTINLCARLKGCPFCRGFKLSNKNSLAVRYPKLAKSWHPRRNVCSPFDIAWNANFVAWWVCRDCGNEFQSEVSNRIKREFVCKHCAWGDPLDLTLYPNALKLFDKKKNKGMDSANLVAHGFYWWKCKKASDHSWYESFEKRTGDKRCPFCAGYKASSTNNLSLVPSIAAQFHPSKNGKFKAMDFPITSTKMVWWLCPVAKDHEWQQRIFLRTQSGFECPFCTNRRIAKSNCLKTTFPKVAKDWHTKKNKKLTPLNVLPGSAKQVWWQCHVCTYEWKRAVYLRTNRNSPCPKCAEKKDGRVRDKKSGQWLPLKKRCKRT